MDNVAEIKEKLSVAEVLRGYINLIPAGKNLKALCPFHKEKTPSFMVSPERGSWYCFGCAEGGDIFSFVMKYEQVEFFEALKLLAEKAGVTIVSGGGAGDAHKQLYEANRLAKDFYVRELWQNSSAHRNATIAYIKERGLKEETVREFEIGLAPIVSDNLLRHLTKEKKSLSDIERAGLVLKSERGTYWDRFRSRLMFPLYNNFGKIIGFTGRVLPSDVPVSGFDGAKYVNSPETPIFNKSKLLYGLHKAKSHIRDANAAIVVEGQMDFLMMWQDGIKNVVASSGTALTREQLEVLRRLADTLILSFDSDPAGLAAAERSIDLAHALDFNVKILMVADPSRQGSALAAGAKDPADVVRAAPGKMAELVKASIPAMEFYFRRYVNPVRSIASNGAGGADLAARKKNLRVVLAKIRDVQSAVERDAYLRDLSLRVGVGDSVLREEMLALAPAAKLASGGVSEAAAPLQALKKSRKEIISERIVALAAADPSLKPEIAPHASLMPADYRTLCECLGDKGFVGVPAELESLATHLSLRAGFEADGELPGSPKHELGLLVRELKREHVRERLAVMRLELQSKESYGDETAAEKLRLEIDLIAKELHTL
jgi:DNA primase